jgi:hypothetical protein
VVEDYEHLAPAEVVGQRLDHWPPRFFTQPKCTQERPVEVGTIRERGNVDVPATPSATTDRRSAPIANASLWLLPGPDPDQGHQPMTAG